MRFFSRISSQLLLGALLPLLLYPNASLGETYTWTDADGLVHFSDSPPSTGKGKAKRTPKVRQLENNSSVSESAAGKWAKSKKKGRLVYQDDMVSVAIVSEGSDYIRVSLMYDLPAELAPLVEKQALTIAVAPSDYNLPKGQYSYLQSTECLPASLSGSTELRIGMMDKSPQSLISSTLSVYMYHHNNKSGQLEYHLNKSVSYKKSWKAL